MGSIPGLGRFPGEGNSYPLQYSDLENSIDCRVHWVTNGLKETNFHFLWYVNISFLIFDFQTNDWVDEIFELSLNLLCLLVHRLLQTLRMFPMLIFDIEFEHEHIKKSMRSLCGLKWCGKQFQEKISHPGIRISSPGFLKVQFIKVTQVLC